MVEFARPKRRRVGPPTVGMPQTSDRPLEQSVRRRAAPEPKTDELLGARCIAVYGPKSGKTTMLRAIVDSAETPCVVLSPDEGDDVSIKKLIKDAERALKEHEVVFIDGAPRDEDEVDALIDSRIIDPSAGGAFIRVWAPDVAMIERGMTPEDITAWRTQAERIEAAIFTKAPRNFFMIPNQPETGQDELLTAVAQIVRRARIRK